MIVSYIHKILRHAGIFQYQPSNRLIILKFHSAKLKDKLLISVW